MTPAEKILALREHARWASLRAVLHPEQAEDMYAYAASCRARIVELRRTGR